MISGLPAATISVTTVPPAVNNGVADPDITVSFQSFRATDDNTLLGTDKDKPEPSPTSNATASIDLGHVGSFQILAYVDSNGNKVWDSGETGLTLPLILVTAAGVVDQSQAHPGNLHQSTSMVGTGTTVISTGTADLSNSGANAGMYLAATFTLIGGGNDGTRGTDRVFAGFSQQIVTDNSGGTYSSGGGTVTMAPVSNAAQGTPDPTFGKTFPAGGAVTPTVLALPVLDSGISPGGTIGGYHETIATQQITSVGPPSGLAGSLGLQMQVEAVDDPKITIPYLAPGGMPNPPLTQFQMNLGFCDSLILWSNVTGNNALAPITLGFGTVPSSPGGWGTTGQWADTVFGVLLQRPWIVSATYNGTGTPIGAPTIASPAVMLPSPLPNGQCSSVIYTPPPTWVVNALPSAALTPTLAPPDAALLLALIFGAGN